MNLDHLNKEMKGLIADKYIVGVTGGIGSGKTSVTNAFADFGIDIVDTDVLARKALEVGSPLLAEVFNHFGTHLMQADKSLNRAKLREEVFTNPSSKQWLEDLVHPWVKQQTLLELSQATSSYIILVSPLLIESGQLNLVKRLLVVDLKQEQQIERTVIRDASNKELVAKIIEQQLARTKRLSFADDIIDNSKDLPYMMQQVNKLHTKYLHLATQPN